MIYLITNSLVIAAIFLFPLWKIFNRAGLDPYLSLTVLIPGFGILIACTILAVSKWELNNGR